MSNTDAQATDMCLLLPWYVNGTLSAREREAVEQHLQECDQCRQDVGELRAISTAVENGEPTPLVPEPPVAEFLEQVFAEPSPETPGHRMHWWPIAASLIAVFALSYWIMASSPEENVFRTVTDPGDGTEIAYVFDIETTAAPDGPLRTALADALQGGDITRTQSGYRLTVMMPSATMKELHEYAGMLEQLEGVQRVEIVGVQLPLE